VSILVQNVRNETSLYYLLSNNYVNELVSIPLHNFTTTALDEFMPTYISFLKTLALRLSASPTLFQFFVDELSGSTFPLFTAAVTAAASDYARTDSFIRLTALNIVVNVCKIQHDAIRRVIGDSVDEQRALLTILTSRLVDQISLLHKLTTGPVVAPSRSDALNGAIGELQDQLYYINDLLQCGVRPLNVRLCEWLLRRVIFSPLMAGMLTKFAADSQSAQTPDTSAISLPPPPPPTGSTSPATGVMVTPTTTPVNTKETEPNYAGDDASTSSSSSSGSSSSSSSSSQSQSNPSTPLAPAPPISVSAYPSSLLLSPSSQTFPGKIISKREVETVAGSDPNSASPTPQPSTPNANHLSRVQYRVRWKSDPEDGSLDEWFGIDDLMREYPEAVAMYEGEKVSLKKSAKASSRRDSLAGLRRFTAATLFTSEPQTSSEAANVLVSLFTLSQFFLTFEYKPLLRMVAVALLHPLSPAAGWQDTAALDATLLDHSSSPGTSSRGGGSASSGHEYVLTPALHGIVQNRCVMDDSSTTGSVSSSFDLDRVNVIESPYRKALFHMISGRSGHPAFFITNMLLHAIIDCRSVGSVILTAMKVLPQMKRGRKDSSSAVRRPTYHPLTVETTVVAAADRGLPPPIPTNKNNAPPSSPTSSLPFYTQSSSADFERSIIGFLELPHPSTQPHLLEAAGALALSYLTRIFSAGGFSGDKWREFASTSKLVRSLIDVRQRMARECLEFMADTVFSTMFVDLMEEQVVARYCSKKNPGLVCSLTRYGASALQNSAMVLVKRIPDPEETDVEDCRFAIQTFLFFRALCDSLSEGSSVPSDPVNAAHFGLSSGGSGDTASQSSTGTGSEFALSALSSTDGGDNGMNGEGGGNSFKFRTNDICDETVITQLGGRGKIGEEVNLEGRTIFRCFPLSEFKNGLAGDVDIMDGKPVGAELYLVVDTNMLYLAEPEEGVNGGEETVVVCLTPMRNITASAVDGLWLHVCIKHAGDACGIIKEGLGAYRKEKQRPGSGAAAQEAKKRLDPKRESAKANPLRTLNLALLFDTCETATIVRGHVEKCRTLLRKRTFEQTERLLKSGLGESLSSSA
jgi:hypothetical protein